MTGLDADSIRASLAESTIARLVALEAFEAIESTNTYLMHEAAPPPDHVRVAITDNQTAGRGRHGRTWQSPPGSGLCLSLAWTYHDAPSNLPALTLAIGLGVTDALLDLGIGGVELKWPNDLVALDGKLGGILTETQTLPGGAIKVVTGVGINVELNEHLDFGEEADWARRTSDIAGLTASVPDRDAMAACLIDRLCAVFADYALGGFGAYAARWSARDWLRGRAVTVDTARDQLTGVGAGVADDGALLIDIGAADLQRITSGSVVMVGQRGARL